MLIGLTGQIGAGKSTVAWHLAKLGAVVIDADVIGKAVVNMYPPLQQKLARAFGEDIVENGQLNRRRLASRAFQDDQTKALLDRIVHPYLLRELKGRVRRAQRFGVPVVIDAALLLQWKLDTQCDYVIGLTSNEQLRVKRLLKRGLDPVDIAARMKLQTSLSRIKAVSDFIIVNNGSALSLEREVKQVWAEIMSKVEAAVAQGERQAKRK